MQKNYNRINIIDDFFNTDDFFTVKIHQECSKYIPGYQPYGASYSNRLKGYPTWEFMINKDHPIYNILYNTLENKFSNEYEIDTVILRKIYTEELLRSPYKGKSHGMIHEDNIETIKMSGVVYLGGSSINDGTFLFSDKLQVEPELIVGSKANRCVIYSSNIPHAAGIEWEEKIRNILVFFLKNKGE